MSSGSGKDISRRFPIDEATRAALKVLSPEVKNELCHVVLNGLCVISAKHRLGQSLDGAISDFETKFKELML